MGFLDPNTEFPHKTTVISCFYSSNEITDAQWICWGDYFDYRSDQKDYLGIFSLLPWESTVKQHIADGHDVIMIYPQRGIFNPAIINNPGFSYIEIPEFYGIYHRFFRHTSRLPDWRNDPSRQVLFLSKRSTYSRQIMWYNLMNTGATGYISYLSEARNFANDDLTNSFENNHNAVLGDRPSFDWCHKCAVEHFPELKDVDLGHLIPYQSQPEIMSINDAYGGWGGWVDNHHMYHDSFICVVGETYIEHPWDQIWTEKIFKPIWFLRPFILIGSTGALSQLRELGFETFGAWIDESYDMEINFRRRMEMIIAETNRLCSLPSTEHQKILDQMRPTLEHNRSNLAKLEQKLDIRQKEIAKFIMNRV